MMCPMVTAPAVVLCERLRRRHTRMRGRKRNAGGRPRRVLLLLTGVAGAASLVVVPSERVSAGGRITIERVSVASSGAEGNERSLIPAIDAEGFVVACKSMASNLIPDDRNGKVDVFVRDRRAGLTERVTVSDIPGKESNVNSFPPALDAVGQLVAFGSLASNLVRGDFNQGADVFVYDRSSAQTVNLTVVPDINGDGRGGGGVPDLPPSITPDGGLVAFTSGADDLVATDDNEFNDVFVRARTGGPFELISVVPFGSAQGRSGNGASAGGAITADGCLVAFYSGASNLVPGDTNDARDVFVRDRCAGATERVSVSSDGRQANGPSQTGGYPPAISADGRYVAFASEATNMVPGDTNGVTDVFIRDRVEGTTVRVEPPSGCSTGGAAAQSGGASDQPSLSADGRFLAFVSLGSDWVADDTNGVADVFVLDRGNSLVARVLGAGDAQPDGPSGFPQLSANGEWIAFQSDARNLVDGDT